MKPILLPTKDSSHIIRYDEESKLKYSTYPATGKILMYHLYIIDEKAEIKEDDWYIDNRVINDPVVSNTLMHDDKIFACKKIIATTDKLLNLPLINEEFVKLYVERQGKIEEVNCEIKQGALISLGSDGTGKNLHEDDFAIVTLKESKADNVNMNELGMEIARRLYKEDEKGNKIVYYYAGFVEGVKKQKERSYSKEEVVKLVNKAISLTLEKKIQTLSEGSQLTENLKK